MALEAIQNAKHALELTDIQKRFKKKRNEYSHALKSVSLKF